MKAFSNYYILSLKKFSLACNDAIQSIQHWLTNLRES